MPITNYLPSSRLIQPGVCTSSTRPASPFEGQAIYETNTDMMAIWNGSAWRYIAATTPTNGTVLQVVVGTVVNTEKSSTSTSFVTTDITATITPKSSSSKILVIASCVAGKDTTIYSGVDVSLFRGTVSGTNLAGQLLSDMDSAATMTASFNYLDSPNTTSAQTYTLGYKTNSNLTTVYVQRNGSSGMMTLMEIAG